VRNYFGPLVYDRVVPASVKFREAYARGIPLIHYDRLSAGAEAYRAAAATYLTGRGQPAIAAMEIVESENPDLNDESPYLREAS
jgi:chromosome partitioning protein